MDSYDKAKDALDRFTAEGGWYIYCLQDEQWYLYNDDDKLIASSYTIEGLLGVEEVNLYCPFCCRATLHAAKPENELPTFKCATCSTKVNVLTPSTLSPGVMRDYKLVINRQDTQT